MSKARTLAQILGSDGILNTADLAGLAAVASSGSATDLTTGTLANARLATGAAVANLGYTPVNKAGDTSTGKQIISLNNTALTSSTISHLQLENTGGSGGQNIIGNTFGGTLKSSVRGDGNGNLVFNGTNNKFYYNYDLGSTAFDMLTAGEIKFASVNGSDVTLPGVTRLNPSGVSADKLITYWSTNYKYGIAIYPGEHRIFSAGDGSTTIGNVSADGSYTYTPRVIVDSSGRVRMPYQPAFKVGFNNGSVTNNQTINSTYVTVRTGRDEFDRTSSYSNATGRFTAPVAGVYLFCIQWMRNNNASGQPALRFGKNGQNINMWSRYYQAGYNQNYETATLITITSLNQNETVEPWCSDAGPVTFYNDDSYFFGYLIG